MWRFTAISSLDLDRYQPVTSAPAESGDEVPDHLRPVLAEIGATAAVVLARNGWVVHAAVDDQLAAKGLVVGSLHALAGPGEQWFEGAAPAADALGELADAFLPDAVVVDVPAGLVVPRPIVVLHWVDAEAGAVFPRTIVRAAEQSEAVVVDYYAGPDVTALAVPLIDIDAAPAANIGYLTVQELGRTVWQIAHQRSRVERDATLTTSAVALGGDYARLRVDARLQGKGATANLLAVYFGDGDQLHDFRTLQDHAGAQTTSDLLFKGVVVDQAHSVYTGMIRVQHGAVGTSAAQTNRNLVLTDGARADSIPNLEILENNLRKCTHASATGPIDEEQQFYLEARGIPSPVAERLIVMGFFDDVLERMPFRGVNDLLRLAVARKLEGVLERA